MEAFLQSVVENAILMVIAIAVTYLTVLHWNMHIGIVIVAMTFVGLITALLQKWTFDGLLPSRRKAEGAAAPSAFATIGHVLVLTAVLGAQYYIIRKRFDLQERIYILAATAFSTDFFKMILQSKE
jgi:hypothetical protein